MEKLRLVICKKCNNPSKQVTTTKSKTKQIFSPLTEIEQQTDLPSLTQTNEGLNISTKEASISYEMRI